MNGAVRNLGVLLALAGCSGEGVLAQNRPGARFSLDAGQVRPDAGWDTSDASSPLGQCRMAVMPRTCRAPMADHPTFSGGREAMQAQLAELLSCADRTIKAALYETTWGAVVDLFATRLSQNPNLTIQLVIDDDQCPLVNGQRDCALSQLVGHPRVTIVDDARSRFMHHKFIIVDDEQVWLTSGNMTLNSFCNDLNNAIVVGERSIVAAFEAEFQRLFVDREFGPTARTSVASGPYRVYFGPQSPLSAAPAWFTALLETIDAAETSVDVMIFAWTRIEVTEALTRARARGVAVRAVVSPQYVSEAAVQTAVSNGLDVRAGRTHDKIAIIDGRIVATGSPNWSLNAWYNNEASLWIDDTSVAAMYTTAFERAFETSSKL